MDLEQAAKQKRLALRRSKGPLSSGTRIRIEEIRKDGLFVTPLATKPGIGVLASASDLVILRPRIRVSV